jgi:hypothetical protein
MGSFSTEGGACSDRTLKYDNSLTTTGLSLRESADTLIAGQSIGSFTTEGGVRSDRTQVK